MVGCLVKLAVMCLVLAGMDCQDHLTTKLLKQAADSLASPVRDALVPGSDVGPVDSYLLRTQAPGHLDLLVRRLQATLQAQVEDNWRAISEPQRFNILKSKDPVVQILKSFQTVLLHIEDVERVTEASRVESQLNNLEISPLQTMREWIRYWDNLRKYIGQIGQLFSYFRGYVQNPDTSSKVSLNDFVSSLVEKRVMDGSLTNMLDTFHGLVVRQQTNDSSLFHFLNQIFTENDQHLCGLSESPHQLLYNLYNIVALTELKGYAMLQFSYMILRINDKGNFTVEAERAKSKFSSEAAEKLGKVGEILPGLSRSFRKCDPPKHQEGQTFLQVKGFLQGYIENEVDMNEWGTCKSQCSDYTYAEPKGCYKDMLCAKQKRCGGRIFDCEFYHADAWVCMSEDPSRRYDWVEYEDGTILGDNKQCKNKIKVDSWWRYIFWHCSYCLCKCDEVLPTSERYWSLEPAAADTDQGMVVTGTRFIKKGKIFHIQIQQAKALPEGGIDESTKAWKEPATVSEENLATNPLVYTMSFEQRAMDLDQLSAPEGYVLTGLKLRSIGGHLNLEIQATPVKFLSGELMKDQSIWIANDNTPATNRPRKLLPIIIPDIPTRLIGQNKVDGLNDEYLQFDTSSAHKDVAQTTIPFMDAQPVSPSPSTWLSGAGVYHKGRVGFGGFIGLSVETFDFSRHLLAATPADDGQAHAQVKVEFVKAEGA